MTRTTTIVATATAFSVLCLSIAWYNIETDKAEAAHRSECVKVGGQMERASWGPRFECRFPGRPRQALER